jgi:hypothetical protein
LLAQLTVPCAGGPAMAMLARSGHVVWAIVALAIVAVATVTLAWLLSPTVQASRTARLLRDASYTPEQAAQIVREVSKDGPPSQRRK